MALIQAYQQEKKVKPGVVTKVYCVSTEFMTKIRHELVVYGRVLPPSDDLGGVGAERGAGVRSLDQLLF